MQIQERCFLGRDNQKLRYRSSHLRLNLPIAIAVLDRDRRRPRDGSTYVMGEQRINAAWEGPV
jgi:hypothetical protein